MTDINDGHDGIRSRTPAPPKIDPTTAPESRAHVDTPAADGGCREHPGIVIRPGPTGPRAALRDGPDVWEVIAALHAIRDEDPTRHGEALRGELATVTGLGTTQVAAALDYYRVHVEDIDARIASNHETAERAQRPRTAGGPPPRHDAT